MDKEWRTVTFTYYKPLRLINLHAIFLTGICFLLMIFLSSCSHVRRGDGPPGFYVDETKIHDAVPRVEPRAKYGNYRSYIVLGKRYWTLKNSKHYEAVGIASWYGTMFHSRKTSSGEPYDMLGMTAAHKTLPLPTYVEVTNLKNNRKIIVKVNDRGPFKSDRIIDLSYVAAKKLHMLGHGTALVKIKAIDPYTWGHEDNIWLASRKRQPTPAFDYPPTVAPAAAPVFAANESREYPLFSPKIVKSTKTTHTFETIRYRKHQPIITQRSHSSTYTQFKPSSQLVYLEVGVFRNKRKANSLRQRLLSLLTVPVKVLPPTFHNKLYRVKVGPLRDVATVEKITRQLESLGIKTNKLFA